MISTTLAPFQPAFTDPFLQHETASAIEVRTVYRDLVLSTKLLHAPGAKNTSALGTTSLLVGVGLCCLATSTFIAAALRVGAEDDSYQRWQADGKDPATFAWAQQSAVSETLVFGGLGLGLVLATVGLRRRGVVRRDFVIGSAAGVDAPVSRELVSAPTHHLVVATKGGYLISVSPQMTAELRVGQRLVGSRAQAPRSDGDHYFSLPVGGRARLGCGNMTFFLTAVSPPERMRAPLLPWRWNEQGYTLGTAGGMVVLLLMILTIPPDPRSLSLALGHADHHFVRFLVRPADRPQDQPLSAMKSGGERAPEGTGRRHAAEEGQTGKVADLNPHQSSPGATGIRGPRDNPDPHLTKTLAEGQLRNSGILGVLNRFEGSHVASIFGRDSALGADAADVLGRLQGGQLAEEFGRGGLGVVGTGEGGGGTGEGTIGVGELNVIGKGSGNLGPAGIGNDRGIGALTRRRAMVVPEILTGTASVRGSLDKEIVRRTIRRHINEVKYCYEQALVRRSALEGRIVVQFTIAPTGKVIVAVLGSSTIGNAAVENCTLETVRRWEFPQPSGGGMVIVSYPFVFAPAGSGS